MRNSLQRLIEQPPNLFCTSKKIPAGGIIVLYNKNKDRFSIFQFNENAVCLLAQGNTVEFGNEVDFDPEILNQIREQK
jgi:hypothetical protein